MGWTSCQEDVEKAGRALDELSCHVRWLKDLDASSQDPDLQHILKQDKILDCIYSLQKQTDQMQVSVARLVELHKPLQEIKDLENENKRLVNEIAQVKAKLKREHEIEAASRTIKKLNNEIRALRTEKEETFHQFYVENVGKKGKPSVRLLLMSLKEGLKMLKERVSQDKTAAAALEKMDNILEFLLKQ